MPRYSEKHNSSLKFDMPQSLRDRFIAVCEYLDISQSEALRLVMVGWVEVVEDEIRSEQERH